MISEMRRKLDIAPSQTNEEGYTSLMVTLQGIFFNEMVYALAATCQAFQMKLQEIIPPTTLLMLLNLMKGENPMGGKLREDVEDQETFNAYYLQEIDVLRAEIQRRCLNERFSDFHLVHIPILDFVHVPILDEYKS